MEKELEQLLLKQEEQFFQEAFLSDDKNISDVITDDFIEYGQSGHIFHKVDTIKTLYGSSNRKISIAHFEVIPLGAMFVQVRYISYHQDQSEVLRSSLWKKDGERWRLYFHQGTKRCIDKKNND